MLELVLLIGCRAVKPSVVYICFKFGAPVQRYNCSTGRAVYTVDRAETISCCCCCCLLLPLLYCCCSYMRPHACLPILNETWIPSSEQIPGTRCSVSYTRYLVYNRTLDNSLLNMHIGLPIGWGRYRISIFIAHCNRTVDLSIYTCLCHQ